MENKILSATEIKKVLDKLSAQVIKELGKDIAVVGIKRRGAVLAERIKKVIDRKTAGNIDYGSLDITLYRDDFSDIGSGPIVTGSELLFDPEDKKILLIDDVLYTGRTVRAAMDQIIDYGRPKIIRLFVLVDRPNCRELPIQADYHGIRIIAGRKQIVEVRLKEVDRVEEVVVKEKT
ncbi:MAG: bifunctional pyr operon transcriptional regulator/uracil phosphoribosyltransferase PyrR [Candidatus Omnitrophica bacterium]|nr:bifunctional pyr operon transcriptional regulator/uracil phosphoribosyltransferase PyrR [Candidatus Omnitrophota bacterium]